jgi:hypothetical protein
LTSARLQPTGSPQKDDLVVTSIQPSRLEAPYKFISQQASASGSMSGNRYADFTAIRLLHGEPKHARLK